MKKLIKLSGALAVVALFAASAITTTNAQEVSMDDVSVDAVESLEAVKDPTWTFVSKHYVYEGTQTN